MTQKTYERLKESRGIMSAIGWVLMIINLFIGLSTLICSFITGDSFISHQLILVTVFFISMVIGLLALIDMVIYRKIKSVKYFEP
jgi:hypothetical protein